MNIADASAHLCEAVTVFRDGYQSYGWLAGIIPFPLAKPNNFLIQVRHYIDGRITNEYPEHVHLGYHDFTYSSKGTQS